MPCPAGTAQQTISHPTTPPLLPCLRPAPQEIATAVEMIKTCLGPLPLFKEREEGEGGEEEAPTSLPIPIQMAAARPAVLADGSYATQTALPGGEAAAAGGAAAAAAANVPSLRCGGRAGERARAIGCGQLDGV